MNHSALLQADFYTNISQAGSRSAAMSLLQNLPFVVEYANITIKLKLLSESFFTLHYGYTMYPTYFFAQQMNRKITQTVESGLMNYWISKHQPIPILETPTGPEVLTLEHTLVGFKIWIVCILISSTTFFVEIVSKKIIDRMSK